MSNRFAKRRSPFFEIHGVAVGKKDEPPFRIDRYRGNHAPCGVLATGPLQAKTFLRAAMVGFPQGPSALYSAPSAFARWPVAHKRSGHEQ